MKVQYQVIEEGTEIELLSTTNHKEANENFGEFELAPCRTVGNKINVNGEERVICRIAFCMNYIKKVDLRLIIEVEQI